MEETKSNLGLFETTLVHHFLLQIEMRLVTIKKI
jgi:hypothetical protein